MNTHGAGYNLCCRGKLTTKKVTLMYYSVLVLLIAHPFAPRRFCLFDTPELNWGMNLEMN